MLVRILVLGLVTGSLYSLMAIALVIIYRSTGILNFLVGGFATLGGYLTVSAAQRFEMHFLLALGLGVCATAVLAALLELLVQRPILRFSEKGNGPLFIVVATLALGGIAENAVQLLWGPDPVNVTARSQVLGAAGGFKLGAITVTWSALMTLAVALGLLLAAVGFFRYTKLGVAFRALANNPAGASLVGIPIRRLSTLAWAMGGLLSAVAGTFLAPILSLTPTLGAGVLLKALSAAALGGFDSVVGAVISAFLIGISENLTGVYIGSGVKDVVPLGLLYLILLVKPAGLFGSRVGDRV